MTAQRIRPGKNQDGETTPMAPAAPGKLASPAPSLDRGLGVREREIMTILWKHGSSNVQQVSEQLSATLAYTTVMTTLDRLFKKGLLQREKMDRAFIYSTALTAREIEDRRAAGLVRRFFSDTGERHDMLVSCLIDAVQHYDKKLLDTLETKIQAARARRAVAKPGKKKEF